ncbi:MAG: hypothetical protein LBS75_08185 [Synergistaceae bacterium]|nr:hypothetical protein [Synergistaceae bacterium]
MRKVTLGAAASSILAMLLAALFFSSGGVKEGFAPLELLSALPSAEANAPLILIAALKGEFPQYASRLFADSAAVSPGGASPVTALLPVFDSSGAVALVMTERPGGFAMYGAFTLSEEEREALGSFRLPPGWKGCFVRPDMHGVDDDGLFQIRANNMASPLYLEVRADRAYIADSLPDIERIREVRLGRAEGLRKDWAIGKEWRGRMFLSDGGVLGSMILGSGGESAGAKATEIEVAWTSSVSSAGSSGQPSGEAEWRISGAENVIGRTLLHDLRDKDWSSDDIFIPDPLIMALGVNLPHPPRDLSSMPASMRYLADQLRKMGLGNADIKALLTGPATISLGGRTQLLWFELPGITLDIPGRGDAAFRLIDKFWTELFLGADPKPIEGYTHGGVTDLPFTVLAAGNEEKAVIGLSASDVEQNAELKDLLRQVGNAVAWFYVDIPKLGVSLTELPAINSILYEYEEGPVDEESAGMLRDVMSHLGRLFVTWESPESGRAVWYY